MKIRVYYEDTDAGGIVYHTNYIKYCERARSEVFFSQGLMPSTEDGGGFVVKNIHANFMGVASLGDILEVTTTKLGEKSASFTLLQEIHKGTQKIFSMEVLLAYVLHGKPTRIPQILRDIL